MTLHSRRVRCVCESRCDWFRRTIEAVLCELTRCWSVLASRYRRSSGPGGVVVPCGGLSAALLFSGKREAGTDSIGEISIRNRTQIEQHRFWG